jgi:hypothetical protein
MRRHTFQEREEYSTNKYSGVLRPSNEVSRQSDLGPMMDNELTGPNNKRYSFLVKASNSPSRRPLTSKNTFGNVPTTEQPKQ